MLTNNKTSILERRTLAHNQQTFLNEHTFLIFRKQQHLIDHTSWWIIQKKILGQIEHYDALKSLDRQMYIPATNI